MIKRFFNIMDWLVIVTAFVLTAAGCEQRLRQEQADVLAYGPDVNAIVVTNDYTPRVIAVTGGYQAWVETKKLQFDCVVTFYEADDSLYLTAHHYEIYPWSNSIRGSAIEPQGKFVWELSPAGFSVSEGAERVLPVTIDGCDFVQAILNIMTAPARLLDKSFKFTKSPEPVRIEGLWYYPIERERILVTDVPYWSKVIFYQNRDSALVDMIWFTDVAEGEFFAVRGYGYYQVEKGGVLLPAKIEIFETDAKSVLQQRLVKIDCYPE